MPKKTKSGAPLTIWLQGAKGFPDAHEITWCWHQIDKDDVKYVRADGVTKLRSKLRKAQEELRRVLSNSTRRFTADQVTEPRVIHFERA